jgi:glycosyltransferase involved in cell wall biosynthesis
MGTSVIICCYNSAQRLPLTLQYLAAQKVPGNFSWEIVLVNNASNDDTVNCAICTWNKLSPESNRLRIVQEDRRGQAFARKTGVISAMYECIVFCDDDNHLDENYVAYSQSRFLKNRRIGAVGGQNLPVTDKHPFPEWFEVYQNYYATGIPAMQSEDVSNRGYLLGAGMITRRSLYLSVFNDGFPSLLNGRNGEKLSTGDDFEYCKRLLLWGYQLFYDERLILHHFIPQERLEIEYRDRLMAGIQEAGVVLNEYDNALKTLPRIRHKNKFRLLLLTPFRVLLARMKLSKRKPDDEKLIFNYSLPFFLMLNKTRKSIKRFYTHRNTENKF